MLVLLVLLLLLPLLLVVPLLLRPPLLPPLPCMRRAVRYYIVFMCHFSCLSAHAHEHAHEPQTELHHKTHELCPGPLRTLGAHTKSPLCAGELAGGVRNQ